jgi:dTDP-4-dehydrorhamnose reductase
MRILITGVSGMLGASLFKILESDNEVYGTGSSTFEERPNNYKIFDFKSEKYDEIIKWSNPDVIILSGALTNGNYCNENPNEAFDINGLSVKKFLNATDSNVKIVYISTDAVFPSKLHLAKENDCVFPENVYGKSKELGEFFTKFSEREFCVIRTTIVGLNINSKKNGFVEWIINSSNASKNINLFDDVIFNPISIWDLGKEINYLVSLKNLPNEILHISGTEISTKYEFGQALLKTLNLNTNNIERGLISSFKDRAKRCNDQTLDCNYYQNKFNRQLPSLYNTLEVIKYHYESN